jgi:hypothetical protein
VRVFLWVWGTVVETLLGGGGTLGGVRARPF